jgi:hypothetical protein
VVTAYPAVLLRNAVSFSSRSVGCRSFWGFLEGICLCSESTCIVNEIMRRVMTLSVASMESSCRTNPLWDSSSGSSPEKEVKFEITDRCGRESAS